MSGGVPWGVGLEAVLQQRGVADAADDETQPGASRGRSLGEKEGPITRFADHTQLTLQAASAATPKRVLTVGSLSGSARNGSGTNEGWTGRAMWPSSAMLATHLWQVPPTAALQPPQQAPLRVLELACGGAALPGMALALAGHHVTFADLPGVLPQAARNVQHNAARWGAVLGDRARFLPFDWRSPVPPGLDGWPDLIVGSDIVYAESHIDHIRRWLRAFLLRPDRPGAPPAEAVLSGENRSDTLRGLLSGLAADGVEVIPVPVPSCFVGARWEAPHPYSKLELYRLRRGGGASATDGCHARSRDAETETSDE